VLTEASVQGKVDTLGRAEGERDRWPPDPAGTGSYLRNLQRIAAKRDEALTAAAKRPMEPLPDVIAAEASREGRVRELQSVSVPAARSNPGPFWFWARSERRLCGRPVVAIAGGHRLGGGPGRSMFAIGRG